MLSPPPLLENLFSLLHNTLQDLSTFVLLVLSLGATQLCLHFKVPVTNVSTLDAASRLEESDWEQGLVLVPCTQAAHLFQTG